MNVGNDVRKRAHLKKSMRLKTQTYQSYYRWMQIGICFLLSSILCSPGFAAITPVFDAAEIAKTAEVISQLDQQYQTLQEQYQTLQSQLAMTTKQYQSMTGNYGWGNWNNSASELTQVREWTAPTWQSALQGMAGGNPGRYAQLLQEYQQSHAALSSSQYQQGADANLSTSYQNQVQTNAASATMASYEFNDMNSHLQTLYQLGQQIENSTQNNDMKSAVD